MAEGAGLLLLEDLETAKARGATIIAELVGYGASADAWHMTARRTKAARGHGHGHDQRHQGTRA